MTTPTKEQLNDRFRFRLWDDELKTYFHSNDDGSLQFDIEKVLDGLSVHEGEVLEQCTGLKDKNGRLIYEGDIIAARFQGKLFTANIKYFRAGWVAEFHYWKPSLYQMCNEAKFEVIGNIHENPELLEDK